VISLMTFYPPVNANVAISWINTMREVPRTILTVKDRRDIPD